jgi:hypothetical protein
MHGELGTSHYVLTYLHCQYEMQHSRLRLAARELLSLDPANTYLVVEHEFPPARIQDKAKLAPILQGSLAFVKAIDEAAAAMYSPHEVMKSQGNEGAGRRPRGLSLVAA